MRSAARGVGLIAGSNLLASLSSYVVFVLASRHMEADDLGEFGLLWIVAMTLAQLIDGGSGSRLVRDIRQIPGSSWLLRQALVRRAWLSLLLAGPVSAALVASGRIGAREALLLVVLVLLLTVYGLLVVQRQSLGSPRSQATLFLINALSFSAAGMMSVAYLPMTTPETGLLVLAGGFVMTVLLGLVGHAGVFVAERRDASRPQDAVPFFIAVVSNVVTGNSAALILGARSGTVLPTYLVAERPAQGATSLAAGLSGYLLPRMSVAEATTRRRLLRLTLLSAPFVLGAAALVTPLVVWLLRELSGKNAPLVDAQVVLALSLAAAISLLSVPTGTLLTVQHRGPRLRDALVLQAVLVVLGSLLALWSASAVVASVAILVARVSSFGVQVLSLRRPEAGTADAALRAGGTTPAADLAPGASG